MSKPPVTHWRFFHSPNQLELHCPVVARVESALMKWIRFAILLLLLSLSAVAQTATPALPSDLSADQAADAVVRQWLEAKFKPATPTPSPNTSDANAEIARQLETVLAQLRYAPVPKNARVSFGLRKLETASATKRSYSYPITSAQTDDAQLTVTLEKTASGWQGSAVTFGAQGSSIPEFVTAPWGGWLFAAISSLLLYACIAPTFWRRSLENSVKTVRANPRVFIIANGLLYGMYIFGTLGGLANPALVKTLGEFFSAVLSSSGISALTESSVASAAFGIALNNLRAGILFASFIPGSFFAVPAYLINGIQFWFYGIALAPVGGQPLGAWLLHVPTIIIELQAYIFVIASSGLMLLRIFKRTPFAIAWREYAACLPLAISLLLLGAWYEAFEIIVLIPAVLK